MMQEAICTFSFSPHIFIRSTADELVTRLRCSLFRCPSRGEARKMEERGGLRAKTARKRAGTGC